MSSGADSRSTAGGPVLPSHLYVHVPLCRSKCAYCDFCSVTLTAAGVPAQEVALQLLKQAEAWKDRGAAAQPLRTLYIGGGTPTILGGGLPFLVASIRGAFGFRPNAEVTVEANPDSVDQTLLGMLRAAGVTRVSLGVQSCNDEELRALGRVHDSAAALRAADDVLQAGLDLSIDLMCGIPGQSEQSWEASLDAVLGTGCNHLSVYPLAIEEGTPLAEAADAGEVAVPDEDAVAAMMERASAVLASAGLQRYEVANYARPGYESAHNRAYWTGAEYLGVGPSAHGMLSADTARALGLGRFSSLTARVRYAVSDELGEGLEQVPPLELEFLTATEARLEDAMLGMRLAVGIHEELAGSAGIVDVLEELRGAGLVVSEDERWRTSERGWLLGNEVFRRIWTG